MGDAIPKTLFYYLITLFCKDVGTFLLASFVPGQMSEEIAEESSESSSEDEEDKPLSARELLQESCDKEGKRKTLTEKLGQLKKAERKLQGFSGRAIPAHEEEEEEEEEEDEDEDAAAASAAAADDDDEECYDTDTK